MYFFFQKDNKKTLKKFDTYFFKVYIDIKKTITKQQRCVNTLCLTGLYTLNRARMTYS